MGAKKLIVSCMKNEGPYIIDWVAHNLSLGFDHFLIYSNDCDDGTDLLLDELEKLGIVTHIRNKNFEKSGPQWKALNNASKRDLVQNANWVIFLDVDEYINIHVGDHTLDALLTSIPDADCISLNWHYFGNNSVVEIIDKPVTEQFTKCSPFPIYFPPQALLCKSLFRPSDKFKKMGIHGPKLADNLDANDIAWHNGNGMRLAELIPFGTLFIPPNLHGNKLATINHYSLRSVKGFLIKSERGLPNMRSKSIEVNYWAKRNFDNITSDSIFGNKNKVDQKRKELLDIAAIKNIHEAAFKWHHDQAENLLQTRENVELYESLILAGSTKLINNNLVNKIYEYRRNAFSPKKRTENN